MNSRFDHKTEPLPHQIEGTYYIENNDNVALFDEQGLGKSKMVIDAIINNMNDGKLDGAIVVCKKTLLQNWKEEINTHSYLSVTIIDGSLEKKYRNFLNRTDFYIVCYESVNSLLPLLLMLEDSYNLAVVLDESQKIKNPAAKTTQAVLELSPKSKKRIIITGTPIANHPEDIWSQFYFLDHGKLLGSDFSSFCREYSIDYRKTNVDEYESKLNHLRDQIMSNSLRRTKSILTLPDKEYEDIIVKMDPQQAELYQLINDQLCDELSELIQSDDVDASTIDNQLVKLLRLEQVTSNPLLIDKNYTGSNPKLNFIDQKLKLITESGEKCIIWTSFVNNINMLKKQYKIYNPAIVYGGISTEQRNNYIHKFKTDPNCKIMIANPAAAKEGLTLVAANNAIYLDRSFKMDDYLQSQDRIHRIGQTKKCHIYKLICNETIDEYVDEILRKKEAVLKYSVGDSDHIATESLSLNYLLEILEARKSAN